MVLKGLFLFLFLKTMSLLRCTATEGKYMEVLPVENEPLCAILMLVF